jgi:fatty acid desaturase
MLYDSSVADFRRRFANAFWPSPWIYWGDLLLSASIGWGAFVVSAQTFFGTFLFWVATGVAVVALLRAAIFIHELTHLKRGAVPGFEIGWHVLVGLPLLLPSLMYVGAHRDHHRQTTFGTVQDPEYLPLAHWGSLRIFGFVLAMCIVPPLLVIRWGIVGPLSYVIPPLRQWLIARASTLVINADYRRPPPQGRAALRWVLQESAAAVVCWGTGVCSLIGWVPGQWLYQWYFVATGILMVNQIRTLAAHRYGNSDGRPLNATEQLLDSITLNGWPGLTALAAPVGLRYHALHHWLPTVPYHSLGAVHRRLLAELPVDAPYRRTQRGGILATVRDLGGRTPQSVGDVKFNADRAAGEV